MTMVSYLKGVYTVTEALQDLINCGKRIHGVVVDILGFFSSHLTLHALNNILLDPPLSNASVTMTVLRMEMPTGSKIGQG